MFKWLFLLPIAVSVLFHLSCTTSPVKPEAALRTTYPDRTIASITNYSRTNPATGKTFSQEYSEAGVGLSSKTIAENDVLGLRLKIIIKWVRSNPIAMFEYLRLKQPIVVTHALPIAKPVDGDNVATVVVSRYKDVVEVLDQPTVFSVRNYTKKMESTVGPFMLAHDNTKYNNVEKPWMRKMMTREDLPRVRQLVKELTLAAIADGTFSSVHPDGKAYGRLEVVEKVARRVPLQLTGQYFGFPGPNIETMARWSKAMQDDFFHNVPNDLKIRAEAKVQGKEMREYVARLIQQRRQELNRNPQGGGDDILTRLLKNGVDPAEIAQFTDERIDDRINSNILGTLIGGVETTQAAIVQSIEQLFARPDQLAGAIAAARSGNDDLLAKYVWEALRFNPVNPFVVRYAESDYVLARGSDHETPIKKGSLILVGTMSAMFDERVVPNPMEFRLDRPDQVYFHLGYGHHRCLGDYISQIQVPEIVKHILEKDGIKPASGAAGQVDMRDGHFPESFVVEYDHPPTVSPGHVQIFNNWFAYEDYLMDFDRSEFRKCLAGTIPNWLFNGVNNLRYKHGKDYHQALLFCRLKPEFRSCVENSLRASKIDITQANAAHEATFMACNRLHPLTDVEAAFYQQVILNKTIDVSKLATNQAQRVGGWDFEDVLKFYDRYSYRETFMNPLSPSSFPEDKELIYYSRLPMKFRMCMAGPVLVHEKTHAILEKTHAILGKDRATQLKACENGNYNEATGRYEGALSKDEKYYYHNVVLHENLQYSQVED